MVAAAQGCWGGGGDDSVVDVDLADVGLEGGGGVSALVRGHFPS